MTTSIWKLKNIVPITKMGVEATFAIASLATAITIIRDLKGTPPPSVFLGLTGPGFGIFIICLFAAIAGLFIAAIYFAAAACASYQQMHKNEEISELKAGVGKVEEKIEGLATKTELSEKADKSEVAKKLDLDEFNGTLESSLKDSQIVKAIQEQGFQKSS